MYTLNQVQDIVRGEMAAFVANYEAEKEGNHQERANLTDNITEEHITRIVAGVLKGHTKGDEGKKKNERKKKQPLKAQALLEGVPVTYCYTHGVTTNLSHNSKTCTRRTEGHKEESTYDNRMGGS